MRMVLVCLVSLSWKLSKDYCVVVYDYYRVYIIIPVNTTSTGCDVMTTESSDFFLTSQLKVPESADIVSENKNKRLCKFET